ncbi:Zn-dependent hydrolase [Halorubrum luteum]
MQVREERLKDDLLANGSFGAVDVETGRGRTVLTGSEADERARTRLVETLESNGMDVRIDPVGNVAGRWTPPSADPDADPVAAGSHLDSVPEGGIFDGPLGVYAAVEAVRAIRDAGYEPKRPIDVVSFTEEEGGRFGVGLLGSSVAGGHRTVEEALELEDDGDTLGELLAEIGFHGSATIAPEQWTAWLELHIEQGTVLEREGLPVGIVNAITGITNCRVEIRGEADHAGSTLMNERTDALVAAAEFVERTDEIAREITATDSEFVAATVGELDVSPGARNIVPGRVALSMDVRDVDRSVMDDVVTQAQRRLARLETDRGVDTELDRYRTQDAVEMSDRCMDALAAASDRYGVDRLQLPSGGGHDTMNLAHATDVGLLFARSRDGMSHSPREWTDWEDCATAAQVLAGALVELTDADR